MVLLYIPPLFNFFLGSPLFFTRSLRAIISASCDPIGIIKGQQQGASMLFLVRWHPVDVLTVSHDLRAVKLDDLIGRNWLGVYFFTWTLKDNILGSSDWFYAILDLLESPWSGLYVRKKSDRFGPLAGEILHSKDWVYYCLIYYHTKIW